MSGTWVSLWCLLAIIGGLAVLLGWACPALARARFVATAGTVRDEVMDRVLEGSVADVQSVRDFIRLCEFLEQEPREVSLRASLARHEALRQCGREPRHIPAVERFDGLDPAARRYMVDQDLRMERAYQKFALDGSGVWWLLHPVESTAKLIRKLRPRGPQVPAAVSPAQHYEDLRSLPKPSPRPRRRHGARLRSMTPA